MKYSDQGCLPGVAKGFKRKILNANAANGRMAQIFFFLIICEICLFVSSMKK
jgi:hypothetical protein